MNRSKALNQPPFNKLPHDILEYRIWSNLTRNERFFVMMMAIDEYEYIDSATGQMQKGFYKGSIKDLIRDFGHGRELLYKVIRSLENRGILKVIGDRRATEKQYQIIPFWEFDEFGKCHEIDPITRNRVPKDLVWLYEQGFRKSRPANVKSAGLSAISSSTNQKKGE